MSTAPEKNGKNGKRMLTVQQVADEAGVSEATAYRWIADGKLPAYRFPGTGKKQPDMQRVARQDFEQFLKRHREGGL